jgi:hypothetical protein
VQFPDLDTRTLQGAAKRLPRDLPAERTLLLLPFHQWQQRQVDAWIARAADAGWAADLTRPGTDIASAVLEVPCISRRWSLGRSFIDGGMAANIRIPTVLARTWTAYTDGGRVQRALDIPDSEQTWVGVLSRSGEVLAHAAGEPTSRSWPPIAEAMTG